MKKTIILSSLLITATTLVAQQHGNYQLSDDETYGYLNCHMSDRGQWTAYALSQDGLHFHDLLCGDSIFSGLTPMLKRFHMIPSISRLTW